MSKAELPKVGDKIPVGKFHVSELNVRAEEAFGGADEDKLLVAQLRRGKVVQPFKARPEGDGFGVVVGRRRFLARKMLGAKNFVVGVDCLIEDMSDEEAREVSLVENLAVLRKELDPVLRAKRLNEILSLSTLDQRRSLRATAARLGVSPTTLSEWLKPLQLSPGMQEALSEGNIMFTDGVHIARIGLGKDAQDKLADVAREEGHQAFKKELVRVAAGKLKRGIPKGAYEIIRTTFDRRYKPDMALLEEIDRRAEAAEKKRDEWVKSFLKEQLKI